METTEFVKRYKEELGVCLQEIRPEDVEVVVDIIYDAYKRGSEVFIMGNGGSASTASHFASDLSKTASVEGKPRIRATSLTDNTALITALSNDIAYEAIFEEQLINKLKKGDVVIGISASGNSPNVLRAIRFAKTRGALTIGLIGFEGGKLKELAYRCIVLSSKSYGPVEDAHLCLEHIISFSLKERIGRG